MPESVSVTAMAWGSHMSAMNSQSFWMNAHLLVRKARVLVRVDVRQVALQRRELVGLTEASKVFSVRAPGKG